MNVRKSVTVNSSEFHSMKDHHLWIQYFIALIELEPPEGFETTDIHYTVTEHNNPMETLTVVVNRITFRRKKDEKNNSDGASVTQS